MVTGIREAEAARGEAKKTPVEAEREIAAVARKSLHWRRELRAGEMVSPDDLIALRPGTGLPPSALEQIVGRQVRAGTAAGALVRLEELAPEPAAAPN